VHLASLVGIVFVPVTRVKPARNHSATVLIESTVGFDVSRGLLVAIQNWRKSLTVARSGTSTPVPRQYFWANSSSSIGDSLYV
jgi:hypothetical protein